MKKWYYFYTPDYEFWHQHLQKSLHGHFELKPILVASDLLRLNEGTGHHFRGCPVKLELLIDCLSANLGNSIIFSDCTLLVCAKRACELQAYMLSLSGTFDLVFARNMIDDSVNIGLILIQCNQRTLKFWKSVYAAFKQNSWDQHLVNQFLCTGRCFKFLSRPGVNWSTFDESRIVCGYHFNEQYRQTYYLYKQFIHPGTRNSNWNQRLKSLHTYGFLSEATVTANLREETLGCAGQPVRGPGRALAKTA